MSIKRHEALVRPIGLLVSLSLALILGLSGIGEIKAQDTPEALSTECVRIFDCTGDPTSTPSWGEEEAIWQAGDVRPVKKTGARQRELVWEQAEGEFQPFLFTAFWRASAFGTGTTSETVTIDADGNDAGGSHPNIRFHKSTVTLCDDFTPIDPFQTTSTHNNNTCIDFVTYNFDVRRLKDGNEVKFWVDSQGRAYPENTALDAVPPEDCGDHSAWTWQTQQTQNLHCRFNTYLVKYVP